MKIVRILVPVDFTRGSEIALDWATKLASRTRGATIYLLHVSPAANQQETQGYAGVGVLMEETDAKRMMKDWAKKLPKDVLAFPVFAKGRIPDVIEKLCQQKSIDLVVMTTRGRRGTQRLLPESTTEETIRIAPCPVLVLHMNPKDTHA